MKTEFVGNGTVFPLTMSPVPPEGIAMTLPLIVTGAPPGVMIAPFASVTVMPDARFWAKFGACCKTAPGLVGSEYVVPSITMLDEPTETTLPAIVACAPGAMVELPIMIPPFGPRTTDWLPTNTGDGAGAACTTAPALAGRA